MKSNVKNNLILIFIALVCSLIWVLVIDNIHYFKNSFKGDMVINDVSYSKEENNTVLTFKTDFKYIDELEFKGQNYTKESIYYNVYAKSNNEEVYINQEKLSNAYDGNTVIRIGKETDEIKLIFVDVSDELFDISNLKVSNLYQVNLLKLFGMIVGIYLVLDLIMIIFKFKKVRLDAYFFKVCFLVGIVISLSSPLYYSLDEKEHFVRAYNISEFNFFKKRDDMVKWPVELSPVIENPASVFVPTTYRSYVNNLKYLDEISKSNFAKESHNSSAEPYLFPGYLVSGIAIFICKILGLSFPYQFFLGRIFNVFIYAFIVALAIKLCKKYDKLIFALGLLPGLVFQSASFSADVLTNAFAILSVALTFYYKDREQKLKVKDLILLTFSYIMSFITKIAYFPIVLLIFLIPNSKFSDVKKSKFIKIFITIFGVLVFGIAGLYAKKVGIVQWFKEGVNSGLQLKYILTNPLSYIYTLYKTIQLTIMSITRTMAVQLGYCGLLGELDYMIIIGILVVAIAKCNEDLKIFDKIILLLVVLLSVGSAMSSMYISYNVVGSEIVDGFQGRYLVPVLLPFLLLFTSSKFKIDIDEKKVELVIMSVMILLNIHSIVTIFLNVYN